MNVKLSDNNENMDVKQWNQKIGDNFVRIVIEVLNRDTKIFMANKSKNLRYTRILCKLFMANKRKNKLYTTIFNMANPLINKEKLQCLLQINSTIT